MRIGVSLLALALTAVGAAQEPQRPRFRAGANLVRVDAYVSKDGVALTDLRPEDLEVYEDDKLQTLESVELVKARAPIPQSERINPTTVRDMRQDAADASRLVTLFFDRFHVGVSGGYHANKPIVQTLDKVIGQDDMVGVMTPEMSPTSITYSRRTTNIERFVTDTWAWGIKDQVATFSLQEQAFYECYPEGDKYGYTAAEMIARLREQQTLDALDQLVTHLEGLRPERKFVMVFTEGWPLYQRSDRLRRPFDGMPPGRQDPLRVDPLSGGIAKPGTPDSTRGMTVSFQACERQRAMLANIDHQLEFRTLLQRANRANVSFYPIDARGLIVFDQPTRFDLPPSVDQAWLRRRHEDLRMMAAQTDGLAVLNSTNDIAGAMQRIFADVGSYYLLAYYSSNTAANIVLPVDVSGTPSPLTLKIGQKVKLAVTLLRRGDYKGPVDIELKNLPANVTAPKVTVPADKSTAELELTAAANAVAADKPDVQIVGTATGAANQQGLSPTIVLKVVK